MTQVPWLSCWFVCKRYANAMVGDGVEAETEAHGAAEVNANSAAEDNKARANDDGT